MFFLLGAKLFWEKGSRTSIGGASMTTTSQTRRSLSCSAFCRILRQCGQCKRSAEGGLTNFLSSTVTGLKKCRRVVANSTRGSLGKGLIHGRKYFILRS